MPNRLSGGGAGGNALTAPIDWITQMFWGIISFFTIFFSTMLGLDPPTGGRNGRDDGHGGNDRRPRRLGGMDQLKKKDGGNVPMGGG